MKKPVRNLAASFRAKLLDHSRATKQDFQFVLDRWIAERFLFRLGLSVNRDSYILKGATMFLIWNGALHRRTRDVDLLGRGSPAIPDVVKAMREVCSIEADDGVVFRLEQISAEEIRADAEHDGVRVRIPAFSIRQEPSSRLTYDSATLSTPRRRKATYREKFHAMVQLDFANSRMKDFFDIWFLCKEQTFQMSRLSRALRGTFARRSTPLPSGRPTALTDKFLLDKQKMEQWRELLSRSMLPADTGTLHDAGESIALFLMPVLDSIHADNAAEVLTWSSKEHWH